MNKIRDDRMIADGKPVKSLIDSVESTLSQRARGLGMTWAKLGNALGMSAQGAYKKASKTK